MAGKFTSIYAGMPYRGCNNLELLAIEQGFRLAWSEAAKRIHCHGIDFSAANEDEISSALVSVFDNIWAHDRKLLAALGKIFQAVPQFNSHYGAVDYRGRSLSFRPDLTFRRRCTPPGISVLNSCLFVEAKVIDSNRTMSTYCRDGLMRFIDGTYAWAVPQAMMIGYVHKTRQCLPDSLAAHLDLKGKREEYSLQGGPTNFPLSSHQDPSYLTMHGRAWLYPETNVSPGQIKVLHLWLPI